MKRTNVEALVAQAKGGDRKAFGDLVEIHQAALYRAAHRMAGHTEAAEAATQDAFVQAYRSLRKFEGRSSFSTWLYAILVRKVADGRRDAGRAQEARSLDEGPAVHEDMRRAAAPGPAEALQGKELAELAEGAMMRLPRDQRAALVLVAQEGLKYSEAAETLGCSEGTVAWRVWNARRLMREMLREQGAL